MPNRLGSIPKTVLLKVSGEAMGSSLPEDCIDQTKVDAIVAEVCAVREQLGSIRFGIVVGGGNIWRGGGKAMNRTHADHMGMMATMINTMSLYDAFERADVPVRAMSAIPIDKVMEPYIPKRANRHLEKGYVVIFAAGLGEPHFTTDTAAAQRALETSADILLKGTDVEGIFDKDPRKHDDAVLIPELTFDESWERELAVMDMTAFTLCRDHNQRVVVFNLMEAGNLLKILLGEEVGTLVTN